MKTFKEAFDNPRRTTDRRTTTAPDVKSPPRRSSYSSDRGVWNMSMGKPKTIKPKSETEPQPKPEPVPEPQKREKYRQPNLPKFPRIPKSKLPKEPKPKKEKKPKSNYRQLTLKLNESQVFIESYYKSIDNSK
jgi:hypothetical protein